DSVPGAVGVNNHEGSKATQDHRVMRLVMEIVKAHHLFWLDSETTTASVGPEEARRAGVRCATRNVFLDDQDDDAAIKSQIEVLVRDAKQHGTAIGIGHARERTLRCILDMADTIEAEGVKLVDIQDLVH
ncbi:MAG: divergent polysaccharide deacetylase family protein, partial [Candidatus Xenobia bacterium]